MSCATGEGHNSAAKAIWEYFKMHKVECEVVDTLSLISPAVSQTASDVYVFSTRTRLSGTEAASKKIPIIHITPIPGCETKNAEFFHYYGMSYSSSDIKEQVKRALRLCNDIPYRDKMISSKKMNINPDSRKDILNICEKSGNKREID